ncbi:hypothetical protein L6R52_23375, partial [Myxococcota bacterium]|nr:hypothetical protein [Myxococcota bacterium]
SAADASTDAGSADAGSTGRLARGVGTIETVACNVQSRVPMTRCLRLTITGCDGVADTIVNLFVSDPEVPIKGTIVFGSGGDGRGTYESVFPVSVDNVLVPLRNAGYRIVQRQWWPIGWLDGPGGGERLGCRPATMFEAIRDALHGAGDGAYCLVGQSGGAAEIAYSLVNFGAEDFVDFAVLTGGPPMGRLDYGCLGENDAAWQAQCQGLRTVNGGNCTFRGNAPGIIDDMYGPDSLVCTNQDESMRQTFLTDSVLSPLADLSYPSTSLRFIWGEQDGSEATPLGRLYYEAITSQKGQAFVTSDHYIPASVEGGAQVVADVIAGCVR